MTTFATMSGTIGYSLEFFKVKEEKRRYYRAVVKVMSITEVIKRLRG